MAFFFSLRLLPGNGTRFFLELPPAPIILYPRRAKTCRLGVCQGYLGWGFSNWGRDGEPRAGSAPDKRRSGTAANCRRHRNAPSPAGSPAFEGHCLGVHL